MLVTKAPLVMGANHYREIDCWNLLALVEAGHTVDYVRCHRQTVISRLFKLIARGLKPSWMSLVLIPVNSQPRRVRIRSYRKRRLV